MIRLAQFRLSRLSITALPWALFVADAPMTAIVAGLMSDETSLAIVTSCCADVR
jgi:hypothetical protein